MQRSTGKVSNKIKLIVGLSCFFSATIALAQIVPPGKTANSQLPEYAEGEVIVRLRSSGPQAQSLTSGGAPAVLSALGGSPRKLFSLPVKGGGSNGLAQSLTAGGASSFEDIYVLSVSNTAQAIDTLSKSSEVVWAEPNYILKIFATANDPFFSTSDSWDQGYDDLWGLKKIGAPAAWDYTRGKGIVVAVVDSGVDWQHPDIAANIWTNVDEIPGNGKDDDGNGFIDDTRGWDFTTCDRYLLGFCIQAKAPDNNPMDENGHGTHVAGTIGAIRNNNIGVVGVAPESKIMAIRGIGANGAATIDQLAVGVRYAIDNGADVINNSWGGAGESQLLNDVFAYGEEQGVVSIAAAGNSDEDVRSIIPAKLPSVITVSSIDENDRKSSFSNYSASTRYGPKAVTGIDVAAPGGGNPVTGSSGFATHVNILSLRAQNTDIYKEAEGYTAGAFFLSDGTSGGNDRYYRASGTSMAAPHVAGVAALALAKFYKDYPGVNRNSASGRRIAMNEVRARVELTGKILASDQKNANGETVHIGERRVNALNALTASRRPFLHLLGDTVTELQGNGNGIPEANERVDLRFEIENKWAAASNIQMQLLPESGGVTLFTGTSALGTIGVRGKKLQETPFSFRAAVGTGLQPIKFTLRITSSANSKTYTQNIPVTVFVGAKKLTSTVARTAHSFLNLLLPAAVYRPAIDDARVVWTDTRNGSYDVYYYNGATAEETQVTNHGGNQGSPDISGNHIVYEDGASGKTKIVYYTISNGQTRILPVPNGYGDHNHMQPRISGSSVVWTASKDYPAFSSDANVLAYSFSTGVASQLSNSKKTQINPDLADDVVVFEDEDISGVRLLSSLFNPYNTASIGPFFSLPLHPRTDGKNVVYTAFSIFSGINVYSSPVESSTFVPYSLVSNSTNFKTAPDIAGDFVVWQEQVNGNWDVYFKNTASGMQQRITFSDIADEQPVVSKYYIAWLNDTILWLASAPGAGAPPPEMPQFGAGLQTFNANIRQSPATGVVKIKLKNMPAIARSGTCSVSFFSEAGNGAQEYLGTLSGSQSKTRFTLKKMPGIGSFRNKRAKRRALRRGQATNVKISAMQVCNGVPIATSRAKVVKSNFAGKQVSPTRWLKVFTKKLSKAK